MMVRKSNVFQMEDHATPSEQASRWVARIDAGPLNAVERQELRDWISSHPGNAELLDSHAMLWSSASRARFAETGKARHPGLVGRWSGPFRRPLTAALASCALAVLVYLGGDRMHSSPAGEAAQYATNIGKTSEIRLEDGSTIHLNTASSTRVDLSPSRRLIHLERGEGYFEVAKDHSRPFDVVAGDTIVRAVGTKFSVHELDAGRVEVTVTEGVVELLQRGQHDQPVEPSFARPVRLAQGQSGLQVGGTLWITQKEERALDDKLSWLRGRLNFDGEDLGLAVAEVNRYAIEKIVVDDPSLLDLKVSGSFNIDDVPVFLKSLEEGFGLRVTHIGGVARISRKDS